MQAGQNKAFIILQVCISQNPGEAATPEPGPHSCSLIGRDACLWFGGPAGSQQFTCVSLRPTVSGVSTFLSRETYQQFVKKELLTASFVLLEPTWEPSSRPSRTHVQRVVQVFHALRRRSKKLQTALGCPGPTGACLGPPVPLTEGGGPRGRSPASSHPHD